MAGQKTLGSSYMPSRGSGARPRGNLHVPIKSCWAFADHWVIPTFRITCGETLAVSAHVPTIYFSISGVVVLVSKLFGPREMDDKGYREDNTVSGHSKDLPVKFLLSRSSRVSAGSVPPGRPALPSRRKVIFTSERFDSETSEYVSESGHAFGRPAFHFRLVPHFETSKIPRSE